MSTQLSFPSPEPERTPDHTPAQRPVAGPVAEAAPSFPPPSVPPCVPPCVPPSLGPTSPGPAADRGTREQRGYQVTKPLQVATDGSALGNPGPGGWAWYVNSYTWASGGRAHTTNNAMELAAVLDLLDATDPGQALIILADSRYVIDSLTKWVHGWKKRGWTTAKGDPVANRDLIEPIHIAMQGRSIEFVWIKGHAGHELNEGADVRARAAATEAQRTRSDTPRRVASPPTR